MLQSCGGKLWEKSGQFEGKIILLPFGGRGPVGLGGAGGAVLPRGAGAGGARAARRAVAEVARSAGPPGVIMILINHNYKMGLKTTWGDHDD